MAKNPPAQRSELIEGFRLRALRLFFFKERKFFLALSILFIAAGVLYPYAPIAMWVGFAFAGYSAVANDSIQTIGTFLASNAKRPWWVLWLFIGGIFVVTMSVSWYMYNGDVSFQRLAAKGFDKTPEKFEFLQLAAPLILLLMTRLRMPVSTTFLCLSAYSANLSGITGMLQKSMTGYFLAFFIAITVWFLLSKQIRRLTTGEAKPIWSVLQWIISGGLWAVWLMQDGANIAVSLPRQLGLFQLIIFLGYVFFGLGILFYLKGDKIQQVVNEKSEVTDVRGATVIDFTYALILLFFLNMSKIPMSTTWVFLGLLAGREVAMNISKNYSENRDMARTFKLILKDATYALIGLIISIITAVLVNKTIQEELLAMIR